ncbi:MAG: hypothetical protein C0506_15865 [Anaerolinea sp.]|nr:hypothetical protein [Anaerolinea sp.]
MWCAGWPTFARTSAARRKPVAHRAAALPQVADLPRYESDAWCFGCGEANGQGLRLAFRRTGPGVVECTYQAPEHLCGAKTVVHGGIQATILDEVMGKAIQAGLPPELAGRRTVTADFSLRYRQPAPMGEPLTARAEFVRLDGANIFVKATLLDREGNELTIAEARWKLLATMR